MTWSGAKTSSTATRSARTRARGSAAEPPRRWLVAGNQLGGGSSGQPRADCCDLAADVVLVRGEQPAVADYDFAVDHDHLRPRRRREREPRKRVGHPRMAEIVDAEHRHVRALARRQLPAVIASEALNAAFGRPP